MLDWLEIVLLAAGGIAAGAVLGTILLAVSLRIPAVAVAGLVLLLVVVLCVLVIIILRHFAYLLIGFCYRNSIAVYVRIYTFILKNYDCSESVSKMKIGLTRIAIQFTIYLWKRKSI
jgi:hypothetical protein